MLGFMTHQFADRTPLPAKMLGYVPQVLKQSISIVLDERLTKFVDKLLIILPVAKNPYNFSLNKLFAYN